MRCTNDQRRLGLPGDPEHSCGGLSSGAEVEAVRFLATGWLQGLDLEQHGSIVYYKKIVLSLGIGLDCSLGMPGVSKPPSSLLKD